MPHRGWLAAAVIMLLIGLGTLPFIGQGLSVVPLIGPFIGSVSGLAGGVTGIGFFGAFYFGLAAFLPELRKGEYLRITLVGMLLLLVINLVTAAIGPSAQIIVTALLLIGVFILLRRRIL